MHRFLSLLFLCLVASMSYAQCPGDECSFSIMAFEGYTSFDTTCATASSPLPNEAQCPDTFLNWTTKTPDVWLEFTPAYTGTYQLSTCNSSSYDTSIVLYQGTCGSLQQIACNGDSEITQSDCQDYYSKIETTLSEGVNYYLRVGGYEGDFGIGTLLVSGSKSEGPTVWYVNQNANGQGSGTSWVNAFTHPQEALNVASSGDQIWVAQGTYTPTDRLQSPDPRESSFRMVGNVNIYGGFEGLEENLSDRNPEQYITILSGDLNDDDSTSGDLSNNSYHVVRFEDLTGSGRTVIDGFVITQGNADNNQFGGGIYINNVDTSFTTCPLIDQCRILGNYADYGGGFYVSETAADLVNRCVLKQNNAQVAGGGAYTKGSTALQNCLVNANHSDGEGGAIKCMSNGQVTIRSTTIVQNTANIFACLGSSSATINFYNSILWGNRDVNGDNQQFDIRQANINFDYTCVEFIGDQIPGNGNTDLNPRFLSEFGNDGLPRTGDERFDLIQQSPLIDAGDNSQVFSLIDLAGNNREINDPYMPDTGPDDSGAPIVDFGCLEHVPNSNNIGIWGGVANDDFNNPKNWLPYQTPDFGWTGLFNTSSEKFININRSSFADRLIINSGLITFDLTDESLYLGGNSEPLLIQSFEETSTAIFKGPNAILNLASNVQLDSANLYFDDNITVNATSIMIRNNAQIGFDGFLFGNIISDGGSLLPGNRGVGSLTINGSLNSDQNDANQNALVGRMLFDIAGTDFASYDFIEVTESIYDSTSIEVRWSGDYTPTSGDSYNILDVGNYAAFTTLVYGSGLPRGFSCQWYQPNSNGLMGGDDVAIETTGPVEFDSEVTQAISNVPNAYTVADIDGINGPDVAMVFSSDSGSNGEVVIFLNNGISGSWQGFTEQTGITVGSNPMDITFGDFTGDGTENDLVIANNGDDSISVLINDGAGAFSISSFTTDASPRYLAVGDYFEDSNDVVDIAVACDSFKTTVLKNIPAMNAGAIFTKVGSLSTPLPADIDPGDVNNDKDLDFILLNGSSDGVRVLEGNGNGTGPLGLIFDDPLVSGSDATELEFADLNNDSFADAITVNNGNGTMSVMLGDGSELGSASSFGVGTNPESVVIADFDNDGDEDLAVSVIGNSSGEREIQVIRNDTETTLTLIADQIAGSGTNPEMVEHGDFNSDGLLDLISIVDFDSANGTSPGIGVFMNITAIVNDCEGDIDGNDTVEVTDLLEVIAAWGSSDANADIDESGTVDVSDLLLVVANWGSC